MKSINLKLFFFSILTWGALTTMPMAMFAAAEQEREATSPELALVRKLETGDGSPVSFIIQLPEGIRDVAQLQALVASVLTTTDVTFQAQGLNLLLLGKVEGLREGLARISGIEEGTRDFLVQLGRIGEQATSLSETVAGHTERLEAIGAQVVVLLARVPEGLEGTLAELRVSIEATAKNIQQNERVIAAERESHGEALRVATDARTALGERTTALETLVPGNIGGFDARILENATQREANTATMTALGERIAALEERVPANLTGTIGALQAQLAGLRWIAWLMEMPYTASQTFIAFLQEKDDGDSGAITRTIVPSYRDVFGGLFLGTTIFRGGLGFLPFCPHIVKRGVEQAKTLIIVIFIGCTLKKMIEKWRTDEAGTQVDVTDAFLHKVKIIDEKKKLLGTFAVALLFTDTGRWMIGLSNMGMKKGKVSANLSGKVAAFFTSLFGASTAATVGTEVAGDMSGDGVAALIETGPSGMTEGADGGDFVPDADFVSDAASQ